MNDELYALADLLETGMEWDEAAQVVAMQFNCNASDLATMFHMNMGAFNRHCSQLHFN